MASKQVAMDELMVAMDAIDALRYEEQKIRDTLDAQSRRARLKEKLREIYAASGIDVTEAMLDAGIDALEQERFRYEAPRRTLSWHLARWYVARDRWLKPLLMTLGVLLVGAGVYVATVYYPQTKQYRTLQEAPRTYAERIKRLAKTPDATKRALALADAAKQALESGDTDRAQANVQQLKHLYETLRSHYRIRIVQEPNTPSGIWRIPRANPSAKNYYLIVEAIDERGNIVTVSVLNEETGKHERVTRWGVRVDRATFEAVARDKKDDGIIRKRTIGTKEAGYLTPHYTIPVTAAITHW